MDSHDWTFTGRIVLISPVERKKNIPKQWVTFAIQYNDPLRRNDFIVVEITGNGDIIQFWSGYNDKHPPFTATVTVQISGQLINQKNIITFKNKKIEWNYI
jgi:RNase P/RNase MRP subunit p29